MGDLDSVAPAVVSGSLPAATSRVVVLDVLRGFALCGVVVVNVGPILSGSTAPTSQVRTGWVDWWLGLVAEQRFFPIFSLLFGVSFRWVLRSAQKRSVRPRLVIARRLGFLLLLGLLHHLLLWSGDVLAIYALAGLLVLLPASWLPPWLNVGLGAALLGVALWLYGGGYMLVPGLFLLGSSLVRLGVVDRIEQARRWPVIIGLLALALAGPAVWWQLESTDSSLALGLAGLVMAVCYCCGVLVAYRRLSPRVMAALFQPLGRMALTNYLSATLLVLAVGYIGRSDRSPAWSSGTMVVIAAGVLALEWVVSTLWLRPFRYGPVEWLWRWATWARRPEFHRRPRGETRR